MKKTGLLLMAFLLCSSAGAIFAQPLTPAPSPKAVLTQQVGVSEIVITWSRPAVKGRKIWGDLVPYGEIWRTGANANTTIKFSDAVTINGTEIPAATYGLHTIPGEKSWTIILSKDNNLSGSFGYKQENDAVRIMVTPVTSADHTERLSFDVSEVNDSTSEVSFRWEKLKIAFTVSFKTRQLIADKINKNFSWSTPNSYAQYILANNMDVAEGIKWVDLSITVQENYWNLRIKAQLLEKSGKKAEAITTLEKALKLAEGMKSAPFDHDAMKQLLQNWKK